MLKSATGWDDTIIALATPPGIGAIGVIRLSGSKAIEVTNSLFNAKDLHAQQTHTLHVGFLKLDDELLDEVVVSIYKGPRSYTGEDVIEISCHGSPYIQENIIKAFLQKGIRLAQPGEFTQRAFLSGKMDLAQAEAVADVIASNTQASSNAALKTMRGGFSNLLYHLREQLIKFSALIELELDFAEEDVEFANRDAFYKLIDEIKVETNKLLYSFKLGNAIKNGVNVAIIGRPNAGKSTLLNALLNDDRAIVSDIAGTTRDTIEEVLNIDGILFRLVDTAGIRETADTIENIGIKRSYESIKKADIVLYIFDAANTTAAEVEQDINTINTYNPAHVIVVANKVDLVDEAVLETFKNIHALVVFTSLKNNSTVTNIEQALANSVLNDKINPDQHIVTNLRHYRALEELQQSLQEITEGLQNNITSDLLALDIRNSLQHLGEITGEVTNDEQLDYIFSKFCIGK